MHNKTPPKLARNIHPIHTESLQPLRSGSAPSWPAPMFCGVNYHLINLLSLCYKPSGCSVQFFDCDHQEPGYLCPAVTEP